jgi:hypothetical protein
MIRVLSCKPVSFLDFRGLDSFDLFATFELVTELQLDVHRNYNVWVRVHSLIRVQLLSWQGTGRHRLLRRRFNLVLILMGLHTARHLGHLFVPTVVRQFCSLHCVYVEWLHSACNRLCHTIVRKTPCFCRKLLTVCDQTIIDLLARVRRLMAHFDR